MGFQWNDDTPRSRKKPIGPIGWFIFLVVILVGGYFAIRLGVWGSNQGR